MVKFKPVPSLAECVKKEIPKMVKNHIIRSAYNLNIQWYVICAGYSHCTTQEVLTIQMERFREYLLQNIVWTDREEVFYLILRGVDDGIMKVRKGWSREKKHDQYMQDEAVALILKCRKLNSLYMSGTNISDEGKARIIMGLPKLRNLVRADYLCDALGWIDYLEEVEDPVFDIREFIPSTSYFFHEDWQMEMVSRMCPNIEKMLFIQHPKCCPTLEPLESFHKLTELQIHGSEWNKSGIEKLLQKLGSQLINLGLIAVKGISVNSLNNLFGLCNNLTGVVFNSCEFDWSSEDHQTIYTDKHPTIDSLEEVVLTSHTQSSIVEWLLRTGPNIKNVNLGSMTHVTDQTFFNLTEAGCLAKLEDIQIERSASLSLETLNTLLTHCPRIASVGDLANWGRVTGSEMGEMRLIAHEQNLALDLSSHQVLRRFLGMGGEDRKNMVTLMTGPVLERIRMAQEEARNNNNDIE